jgi:hypothetical protein
MQVVTPDNMQQLIETGKVDDFKPPEAVVETKEQPRNDDGTFKAVDSTEQKVDKETTTETKVEVETKADDPPVKVESDDESDDESVPSTEQ